MGRHLGPTRNTPRKVKVKVKVKVYTLDIAPLRRETSQKRSDRYETIEL